MSPIYPVSGAALTERPEARPEVVPPSPRGGTNPPRGRLFRRADFIPAVQQTALRREMRRQRESLGVYASLRDGGLMGDYLARQPRLDRILWRLATWGMAAAGAVALIWAWGV